MSGWWERFPARLDEEIEALRKAGAVVHRADSGGPGTVGLVVRYPVAGQLLPLVVLFPDLYPYFPPQVFAPSLRLARHQNPFDRCLCLLGGGTHAWQCDSLVADLLREQLPGVLRSNAQDADPAELAGIEGI